LGHLPGLLRLAKVGPLGEKAGSMAAAVGTRRMVRAVEGLLDEFRELAQGFEQVGDFRRAGCAGRLLEDQEKPRPTCQVAFGGMPEPIVALVAPEGVVEFRGHGRHAVKIVTRQEFGLASLEPLARPFRVTLGAGPIAARVESPERPIAVVASIKPSTQFWGAAGRDIRKGPFLRRHHQVSVL